MKPQIKISFKSFDNAILSFFRKRILAEPVRSKIVGDVDLIHEFIEQLSKNYRKKPFKKKSSYRLNNYGPNKIDIKIGYIFENNKLYFKLFIRKGLRYVRLTQMVIKFKDDENV